MLISFPGWARRPAPTC